MVFNQLLSFFFFQIIEWVVLASKVSIETLQRSGHFFLNFQSLSICNTWSQRECFKISTHTDTSAYYHFGIFRVYRRSIQSIGTHVCFTDMLFYSVVTFDHVFKEVLEGNVGIMRPSVDSCSRISVLASRKYTLFETNSRFIFQILVLCPYLRCEALKQQTFSSCWEYGEMNEFTGRLECC